MGRKSNKADKQPVSPQVIGHAFVQQYYHILRHSPDIAHRFYKETSKLTRPENDGTMSVTSTVKGIGAKIVSLNYGDFKAEIKSVDAQESLMGAVDILVTGYMTGKDNTVRFFVQSFFLEPQDNGYYVLIDMLRFEDLASANPVVVAEPEVVLPAAEPQVPVDEVQDDTQLIVESITKIEDVPKKS